MVIVRADISWFLAGLLLIPYLLWGVFLLHKQLAEHVQFRARLEAATLAALIPFFVFEFSLLKTWLGHSPVQLVVAASALFVSAVALYGPMGVSFASHMLVEIVMPRGYWDENRPQYGAAEGCEMRGDFEGAVQEYFTQAAMFPAEPLPALRAADNLTKLDRYEEAAEWFERGLERTGSAEENLRLVNRLCEIYQRQLGQPDKATHVLANFLERFPESEYAESVRRRLDRIKAPDSSEKPATVPDEPSVLPDEPAVLPDEPATPPDEPTTLPGAPLPGDEPEVEGPPFID